MCDLDVGLSDFNGFLDDVKVFNNIIGFNNPHNIYCCFLLTTRDDTFISIRCHSVSVEDDFLVFRINDTIISLILFSSVKKLEYKMYDDDFLICERKTLYYNRNYE